MALNDHDREWLEAMFERKMSASIEPIRDELQTHRETLFGPKGENGMYKTVKDLKARVNGMEKKHYIIEGALGLAIVGKEFLRKVWGG